MTITSFGKFIGALSVVLLFTSCFSNLPFSDRARLERKIQQVAGVADAKIAEHHDQLIGPLRRELHATFDANLDVAALSEAVSEVCAIANTSKYPFYLNLELEVSTGTVARLTRERAFFN